MQALLEGLQHLRKHPHPLQVSLCRSIEKRFWVLECCGLVVQH